jgi:hypothetical protein
MISPTRERALRNNELKILSEKDNEKVIKKTNKIGKNKVCMTI